MRPVYHPARERFKGCGDDAPQAWSGLVGERKVSGAMSDLAPYALVLVVAIVAIAFFLRPQRDRGIRAIASIGRKKIADVKDGEIVRVVGKLALHGEPLLAPVSSRPCAFYEARVEEKEQQEDRTSWRTIVEEIRGNDFVIDDGSGHARVAMARADVVVVHDSRHLEGFLSEKAAPEVEKFLARHGEKVAAGGKPRELHYVEGVLEAPEEVAAAGKARWENDGAGKKRLVLEPIDATARVLVSDEPGARGA
jgi:hypothetical protein